MKIVKWVIAVVVLVVLVLPATIVLLAALGISGLFRAGREVNALVNKLAAFMKLGPEYE